MDNLDDRDSRIKESEIYQISNTQMIAIFDQDDEYGERTAFKEIV